MKKSFLLLILPALLGAHAVAAGPDELVVEGKVVGIAPAPRTRRTDRGQLPAGRRSTGDGQRRWGRLPRWQRG